MLRGRSYCAAMGAGIVEHHGAVFEAQTTCIHKHLDRLLVCLDATCNRLYCSFAQCKDAGSQSLAHSLRVRATECALLVAVHFGKLQIACFPLQFSPLGDT